MTYADRLAAVTSTLAAVATARKAMGAFITSDEDGENVKLLDGYEAAASAFDVALEACLAAKRAAAC